MPPLLEPLSPRGSPHPCVAHGGHLAAVGPCRAALAPRHPACCREGTSLPKLLSPSRVLAHKAQGNHPVLEGGGWPAGLHQLAWGLPTTTGVLGEPCSTNKSLKVG